MVGDGKIQITEIIDWFQGVAMIYDISIKHQQDLIKLLKDLGGWLMDSCNHSPPFGSKFIEELYDMESSCWI